MLKNSKIITTGGLIGAGISSLLRKMEFSNENILFVIEPLELFQNFQTVNGTRLNPLEMYYQDQKMNATGFQFHILDSYETALEKILSHPTGEVKIL